MSPYDIKLQRVEDNLIKNCKECFTQQFNSAYFNMWLSIDATGELCNIYESEFKKEFNEYINNEDMLFISYASSNLVYHVDTVISIQPTISLNILMKYIDKFIKVQLEDFSNACDHIQMTMYDETELSNTQQNPANNEDNPSNT